MSCDDKENKNSNVSVIKKTDREKILKERYNETCKRI